MAKKVVAAEIEIKTANSIADLKALKKQLKDTAAGSEEFKKLYNQIDDLEDKIKGSKKASSDWIDTLESAGGPLGAIGASLNKAKVATQSFGGALKATGIGLFVAAIGGLVAAFSQTDGSLKKLQPLLIGMEKIFGGIVKIAEPLIDALLDFGLKALPSVTDAIGSAYSVLSSFLGGLGKLGAAIGKLIKGDFVGAWDEAKKSVTEFGTRYEDANKRFIEGTKEVTKTEKDELEKRKIAREKAAAEAKAAAEKEAARLKQEALDKLKKKEDQQQQDIADAEYLKGLEAADDAATEKKAQDKQKSTQDQLAFDVAIIKGHKEFVKNTAAEEKAIDDALTQSKISNAYAIVDVLGNLNAIAGENEIISKGLALTQIGIDTAQAISALVKNSEQNPLNGWTFGGAGVTQFLAGMVRITANIANAKKLLSSKSASIGAINSVSMPMQNVSAPLMAQASTTTLNQNQVNQIGNVAARAFVVESDVTGNQERIQRLNRAARIN